jgi:hypothetical protein
MGDLTDTQLAYRSQDMALTVEERQAAYAELLRRGCVKPLTFGKRVIRRGWNRA